MLILGFCGFVAELERVGFVFSWLRSFTFDIEVCVVTLEFFATGVGESGEVGVLYFEFLLAQRPVYQLWLRGGAVFA